MKSDYEELSVNARGMTLTALAWGNADDKPLLALHGWMDNAMSFSYLAPLIKNRRVIALEFPGHGRSDHRPVGASYFLADYVLDVCHVIDEFGWQSCELLGHSLGAGVGSLIAGSTSRIESLALLDGIGPFASPDTEAAKILSQAVEQSVRFKASNRSCETLDELVVRRHKSSPKLSVESIERLVRRSAQMVGKRWQWRTDPRLKLASPTRFSENGVSNILSNIDCPTMHIGANDGLFADSSFLSNRLQQVANIQSHWIDGNHHFHMTEQAGQLAALINKFLSSSTVR